MKAIIRKFSSEEMTKRGNRIPDSDKMGSARVAICLLKSVCYSQIVLGSVNPSRIRDQISTAFLQNTYFANHANETARGKSAAAEPEHK
jgi:hypothetical protein